MWGKPLCWQMKGQRQLFMTRLRRKQLIASRAINKVVNQIGGLGRLETGIVEGKCAIWTGS